MRAQELSFSDLVRFRPDQGTISFCTKRALLVQADAMGALRKELIDTLGFDVAQVILTRYGYSCGQDDAKHLAPHMAAEDDAEYVLAGPRLHMFEGVAVVATEKVEVCPDTGDPFMSGTWHGSYEAEQHLRLFGRSQGPACWTLAGYASGFSSHVFKTPMICIEDMCQSRGDSHCSWRLIPAARCDPELDEYRRRFAPLNIRERLDLLEQKLEQHSGALAASESRYRDLVDDVPEMVFSLDERGRLVHLNRAGRLQLGLDAAMPLPLPRLMPLRDRQRVARFLDRVARTRSIQKLEVLLRAADGTEIPVQLQINPVLDGERIAGFRGLAVDIASRQARERELTAYAHSLENRLAQASRLAGLGQFASGIAHEINNPMGLISGYAEELLEILDEAPALPQLQKLKRDLATIQEQAYRCKYITQNLLSFAREQAVNPEPTDLAALVRGKVAFFAERTDYRGVRIEVSLADLPMVRTDQVLYGQVLLNLLKNAAEAMRCQGRIRVALTRRRANVRLEVADSGPGLPPEVIDKVFDPFFTTKGPNEGSGLGLSICYGIVRSLGGRIACGNRAEGGAWFRVDLPLEPHAGRGPGSS